MKIELQHYAGATSLYIQEGRQDKGRKTAPRAGARDSVMSGRLLISGRHLWSLMSGRLLISGRHHILTATPAVFGFAPESALLLSGLSTEIPIEQRPCVESIPKAEYSFQT